MSSHMNQSSNNSSRASNAQRSNASFIEALKSIGGQTVSSVSHDVVGGVSKDFIHSLTNSNRTDNDTSEFNQSLEGKRSLDSQINDEIWRAERHRELTSTPLFNRKEVEAKTKIEVIQEELKILAAELGNMDKQLEKAITEEVVSPGAYHVSFFEKLRNLVINMRKQVADSSAWLETSAHRKDAKNGYWSNVGKSGSKYLLSQERTLATQAG